MSAIIKVDPENAALSNMQVETSGRWIDRFGAQKRDLGWI